MIRETNPWLSELRLSRSSPPQLAASDPNRASTYNAALQQFEELLTAASVAGVSSQPLPMFYALSQAGRAIAAARAATDRYEIEGHGLQEDRSSPQATDILQTRVKRKPFENGSDAFSLVSQATGSGDITGSVELGAIWAATPDLHRLPADSWSAQWTPALDAIDLGPHQPSTHLLARLFSFSGNPLIPPDQLLTRFPTFTSNGGRIVSVAGDDGSGDWVAVAEWRDEQVTLDEAIPANGLDGDRRVIPLLPSQEQLISPLMLVWLLLFGLSIHARYHPALWQQSLAVDSSNRAVPLENVLAQMHRHLPRLVHRALLG